MNWWCAATGRSWSWAWAPYLGVWMAVALIGVWYAVRVRPSRGRHIAFFAGGLVAFWLANDWPVGALAGYLATLHTIQWILLSLVAAPFFLLGLPESWLGSRGPRTLAVARFFARPVIGLAVFTTVLFVTHVPEVVEQLRPSQLGSFGMDITWLLAGCALWWPVIAPADLRRISGPIRILYLFVSTIPPVIPAAFLTFADFPIYRVYELAPRVAGITAATDQQAAGVLMKALADPIIWIAMAIIFFRWHASEERSDHASTSRMEPSSVT